MTVAVRSQKRFLSHSAQRRKSHRTRALSLKMKVVKKHDEVAADAAAGADATGIRKLVRKSRWKKMLKLIWMSLPLSLRMT